jgi:hypothetical protein
MHRCVRRSGRSPGPQQSSRAVAAAAAAAGCRPVAPGVARPPPPPALVYSRAVCNSPTAGCFNANGGSPYCHFGREWECFVRGREPSGGEALGPAHGVTSTSGCQAACAAHAGCEWWVLRNASSSVQSGSSGRLSTAAAAAAAGWVGEEVGSATTASAAVIRCDLIGAGASGAQDCASSGCEMGPKACPGMQNQPSSAAMSNETVNALVSEGTVDPPTESFVSHDGADVMSTLAKLDDEGWFNSGR